MQKNNFPRWRKQLHWRDSWVLLPIALYLWLALQKLSLPGLHNDEAQEAGLQALQLLTGAPVSLFRGVGLFGRFPLVVQDYIGAFNVYLVLPFIRLMGPSAVAIRLPFVLLGTGTLFLLYGWVRAYWGRLAGFLSVTLLAIHPAYIFWSRQGVLIAFLTLPLAILLVWQFQLILIKATPARWFWLGLTAGLGLCAKLLFLWLFNSLSAIFAVWLGWWAWQKLRHERNLRQHWQARRCLTTGLIFACGLGLGFLPILLYNLQSGGTFQSVRGNLSHSFYGVNNSDLWQNLQTRIEQLRALLASREHLWQLGMSQSNRDWESLFVLGLLGIGYGIWRKNWQNLLLLALSLLTFLQSIFTVSDLFHHHLALLLPFIATLSGVGLAGFSGVAQAENTRLTQTGNDNPTGGIAPNQKNQPTQRKLPAFAQTTRLGTLALLLVGWVSSRDLQIVQQTQTALRESGGYGAQSDAIYRLAHELDRFPADTPMVALDWGISQPIRYLTVEKWQPQELFGYSWEVDDGFEARMQPYLENPASVYIFHWAQETVFPGRREALEALAAARGLQVEHVTTVGRGDGSPFYDVWMIHPKETP